MGRFSYFTKRLILMVPVFFFSVTMLFVLFRMGPLDPVSAVFGMNVDPHDAERLRRTLGLNEPLWKQYIDFMVNMLTLDFGESWVVQPGTSSLEIILSRLPRTMWLGFWSVLIAIFIGIPLGFYAGLRSNSFADYIASFGGIVWTSTPNFWLGVILLAILSKSYIGDEWMSFLVQTDTALWKDQVLEGVFTDPDKFLKAFKLILPAALVLGSGAMGNEIRIARTAMVENINSQYVDTAKAKGLSGRKIVWKHVFRNTLIALLPVIMGEIGLLIGGSVIVETVFGINGLGKLYLDAMGGGDMPLAAPIAYTFILLGLLFNILQDFLYTIIDPRVAFEAEEK